MVMALHFCMGTAGELIKVYPLLCRADEQKWNWRVVHTGQSGVNFWKQWDDFQLDRKRVIPLLDSQRDLSKSSSALKWFVQASCMSKSTLHHKITEGGTVAPQFFFVHGDTLSTLVGATIAWRMGWQLVHVEAGLRSQFLLQPFPEEINRRLTSEIAHWHMVPDGEARMNLVQSGVEEGIVNTEGNTLIDAVRMCLKLDQKSSRRTLPNPPYVVANLHRHENLSSERRWQRMIETLLLAQKSFPVYFVLHAPTQVKLEKDVVSKTRLLDAGVQLLPRMIFTDFIHLLNDCEFVLSDGGSNQEECFYLGKPCLLLRQTTERLEGIGENALLSEFKWRVIQSFIEHYRDFRREPQLSTGSPSELIFQSLGL